MHQVVEYLDTVAILAQETKVVPADAAVLLHSLVLRDAVVVAVAQADIQATAAMVAVEMQPELLQALLVVLLMHQVVVALVVAVDILTLALALAVVALEYTDEVIPVAQTLQEIQFPEVGDQLFTTVAAVQELILLPTPPPLPIPLDLVAQVQYVSYGQVLRGIFPIQELQTFDRPQTQLMHTCIKKITVSFG